MARDYLTMLLERAVAATMESPSAMRQLERQLRREHGGTRHYIAKHAPAPAPEPTESRPDVPTP